MIINPRRIKQIEEFIDKDHKVSLKYYELLERNLSPLSLKRGLRKLIDEDPQFLDPYLDLADIFYEEEKFNQAKDLFKKAFQIAMKKIVNKEGKWPKLMEWGWLENRHIIRAIDKWAMELWWEERTDEALMLFRNLLKTNPNDNIGARYSLLAIRMNLSPLYECEFYAEIPGFLDAHKISQWFEKNSKKFPKSTLSLSRWTIT